VIISTKQDFTPEEWNLLLVAPVHAATYIMTANMSLIGAIRDMHALGIEVTNSFAPESACELITSISNDIQVISKNKEKVTAPKPEQGQDPRKPAR
jgi:hypothetical protein